MFPNGDKYEGEYIQTDGGHKERTGQGIIFYHLIMSIKR